MIFKEICLLKNLNHSNIVKILNCYTLQKEMKVAIVLEYLDGGDLKSYLDKQQNQHVDEETARKIFLQLFNAIQYCHREKIIHRDLKLENIMFASKNYDLIKVVDFGISGTQSLVHIDYTQAGSARYFAPEVLSSKAPAHPSIDIWAMGCILFWILVGHSPFPQNTREEVFAHILKGNYSFPSEAKARLSQSVMSFIDQLLQVDLSKRATMVDMANHPWIKLSFEEMYGIFFLANQTIIIYILQRKEMEQRKIAENNILQKAQFILNQQSAIGSIKGRSRTRNYVSKKEIQKKPPEQRMQNLSAVYMPNTRVSQDRQRKGSLYIAESELNQLKEFSHLKQPLRNQMVQDQRLNLIRKLPYISQTICQKQDTSKEFSLIPQKLVRNQYQLSREQKDKQHTSVNAVKNQHAIINSHGNTNDNNNISNRIFSAITSNQVKGRNQNISVIHKKNDKVPSIFIKPIIGNHSVSSQKDFSPYLLQKKESQPLTQRRLSPSPNRQNPHPPPPRPSLQGFEHFLKTFIPKLIQPSFS